MTRGKVSELDNRFKNSSKLKKGRLVRGLHNRGLRGRIQVEGTRRRKGEPYE